MMFEKQMENYAEIAIKMGINLKEKEGLVIKAEVANADFVKILTRKAYEAGAKDVQAMYFDAEAEHMRYVHGADYCFEEFPKCLEAYIKSAFEDNYHMLSITSPNPDLYKDVSSELLQKVQMVEAIALEPLMMKFLSGEVKSSIIAVPNRVWAKQVFPDLDVEEAYEKLWDNILRATRSDRQDPIKAWEEHDTSLDRYKKFLNGNRFEKIHFKSAKTDLEVHLADTHQWIGGSKENAKGEKYFMNIPTEEVYTTPHYQKVNGKLHSTKPLFSSGKIVDDFWFEFKDGKVVDYDAKVGYDVLKSIVEFDEGSSYLGEVALVQTDSPIANTNILFKSTLFDENASIHFALGRALPFAMENGIQQTPESLKEKGANISKTHVDFMVGSTDMDVIGYTHSGKAVKIFEKGLWCL